MPLQWRVFTGLINSNLMLRSRAQRGVSKHGRQQYWCPPFETRPCGRFSG